MNLYTISLFVHLIGVISLFGGLVILQNAGARLRGSANWQEARTWLQLLQIVRGMFVAAGVLLLASGLVMTKVQWTYSTPWVAVAMVVVVLFAIAGIALVGSSLRRVANFAEAHEGPISAEDRSVLASPLLWSSIFGMNGAAVSMLWLMATKPGWAGAIGVPLVLTIVGTVIGIAIARRGAQAVATRPIPSDPLAHGGRGTR